VPDAAVFDSVVAPGVETDDGVKVGWPPDTSISGVRFWSNGRMIVLLFGEFTSCLSAWM
jgi:hypothetical protein